MTPTFGPVPTRHSLNQGDTPIPMAGLEGRVTLTGDLAPFTAALAVGETCHVGSHTALGLGRYVLSRAA